MMYCTLTDAAILLFENTELTIVINHNLIYTKTALNSSVAHSAPYKAKQNNHNSTNIKT